MKACIVQYASRERRPDHHARVDGGSRRHGGSSRQQRAEVRTRKRANSGASRTHVGGTPAAEEVAMRLLSRLAPAAVLPALLVAACASSGEEDVDMPDFESFADGKEDTAYIGSRAAELNAVFTGTVRVLVPGKTPAELATLADTIKANPSSWEHRDITGQVTEQIKYARNALKTEKLNLNLEGGSPTFSAITVIDGGLELAYEVSVESLVKFKELEAQGLQPADLVGKVVESRLPLVPAGLLERISNQCATDPDAPGAEVPVADLGAHNLFYYFDTSRAGCPLGDGDLVTTRYEIRSSLDAPIAFPEYDRLVADKKVTMGIVFGQIEHGDLQTNDWGFISFNAMTRAFRDKGFRVTSQLEGGNGHKLAKTYTGGLVVEIEMWNPKSFADHVDRAQSNETFRSVMKRNEVFYYNGHAFYGSLTVLDERTAYPEDTYQVLFMDACWSYAYYTKQIFRNKATESDPTGYALVDVVNNTEPGITGSEHTAVVLYDQLFTGAAKANARQSTRLYSWNNIVKYMNEHAERRAEARGGDHPDPEIYGVSGARDNAFGRM
jgi:hypothetical protein